MSGELHGATCRSVACVRRGRYRLRPDRRTGTVRVLPGTFSLHHGGRLSSVQVAGASKARRARRSSSRSAASRRTAGSSAPATAGSAGGRNCRARPAARHGPLPSARHRLPRRQRRDDRPGAAATAGFPASVRMTRPSCWQPVRRVSASSACTRIAGASYGGMVALAFARALSRAGRAPARDQCARTAPTRMATGWRSVQRRSRPVRARRAATDRAACGWPGRWRWRPTARARSFSARFRRIAALHRAGRRSFRSRTTCSRAATTMRSNYVPEAFLCLSESIDLHRSSRRGSARRSRSSPCARTSW